MNQYIFYMTTVALANNSVSKESMPQLNILEIILNSSPIVMGVLLLLMGFSLVSWAIIFHKWRVLGQAESSTENFLEVFWSGKSMDHIYSESKKYPNTPLATIFQAGYKELQRLMDRERQKTSSKEHTTTDLGSLVPPESSIENLERSLNVAARREALKLESSMTFLATAASTAPFIGLFGTVWGIMNSFQNIGAQGGASLATVAPGIAEALVATAVGLACAIPATMGYNYFNNKLRGIRARMENFGSDFLNIVKRNFLAS
ncbi:MAG: protein TolQ [Proteobacteria bacterium]|nr:protein TolQ [Pseudomonadota bacterium]